MLPGTPVGSLASPFASGAFLKSSGGTGFKGFECSLCSSIPQWLPNARGRAHSAGLTDVGFIFEAVEAFCKWSVGFLYRVY